MGTHQPDTHPLKRRVVLPSSSPLARSPFGCTRRGSLSRSVFRRTGCFPVPQGTCQCLCQDVTCGIVISVQYHATTSTAVGTHTQRLLHDSVTCATFLARELWCYSNNWNIMHQSIGFDPGYECSPACIMDGLSKVMVPHHVVYLKVFRQSNREMRQACLPFSWQSLHAAC